MASLFYALRHPILAFREWRLRRAAAAAKRNLALALSRCADRLAEDPELAPSRAQTARVLGLVKDRLTDA
ncbi:MAG: hypothetical protein IOD03_07525 [Methylocystis sp.]|nr:hypothetical protein [Methylocystis sp.]